MIVHHCQQGTSEWQSLRMGKPTASEFSRILTPTGKRAAAATRYMYELLAELMLGRPLEGAAMPWMIRGSQMESEARAYYELVRDTEVQQVGFVTLDDRRAGASPDGLVGDDGLVEIKCPKPEVHAEYLISGVGAQREYRCQLQGQLWVCERQWVDIVSYHPGMPESLVRVERDEEFISLLSEAVAEFCDQLVGYVMACKDRGWIKETPPSVKNGLEFTEEDIQAILRGGSDLKPQEDLDEQLALLMKDQGE